MSLRVSAYDELREQVSLADYIDALLEVQTRLSDGTPFQAVCPICGSGTGAHRTGAFTLNPHDPEHWKCFACDEVGDVFDLAGVLNGTDKLSEQAALVAEWAHIDLDGLKKPDLKARMEMAFARRKRQLEREARTQAQLSEWAHNQEAEAKALTRLLEQPLPPEANSYLIGRNIDEETARRWRLGYNPASKRLVIPYPGSDYYHVDRDITDTAEHKYSKPPSQLFGSEPMWNPHALEYPFIVMVEGQLDALAVADVGFEAVACGGVGTSPTLSQIASRGGYAGAVLLMHDNDERGRTAAQTTEAKFKAAGIKTGVFKVWPQGIKDPFEWWQRDRDGLRDILALCYERAHHG